MSGLPTGGSPHATLVAVGLQMANVAAAAITATAWIGYLPPLAAGFAVVLYGIQIWESETVRGIVSRLGWRKGR